MFTPKSVKSSGVRAHISERLKPPLLARRIGIRIRSSATSRSLFISAVVGIVYCGFIF